MTCGPAIILSCSQKKRKKKKAKWYQANELAGRAIILFARGDGCGLCSLPHTQPALGPTCRCHELASPGVLGWGKEVITLWWSEAMSHLAKAGFCSRLSAMESKPLLHLVILLCCCSCGLADIYSSPSASTGSAASLCAAPGEFSLLL